MVLGHSMAPEFNEGEIIVIEPDGLARDGSFDWNDGHGEVIFGRIDAVQWQRAPEPHIRPRRWLPRRRS